MSGALPFAKSDATNAPSLMSPRANESDVPPDDEGDVPPDDEGDDMPDDESDVAPDDGSDEVPESDDVPDDDARAAASRSLRFRSLYRTGYGASLRSSAMTTSSPRASSARDA